MQAIERAPERPDLRVGGLRIGFAEKREVVLGRANGMDFRQLAPELLGKADAIAAERFVLGDARPQADPLDQAHHGERRADHLGIVAEPDGLRHPDADAVCGREDRELLGPGRLDAMVAGASFRNTNSRVSRPSPMRHRTRQFSWIDPPPKG